MSEIYKQVAIEFTVHSIEPIRKYNDPSNPDDWLDIAKAKDFIEADEMMSTHYNTGGVEIYFVREIEGTTTGFNYSPNSRAAGLVIEAGINSRTISHELGHTSGLKDIYEKTSDDLDNPIATLDDSLVKEQWLPYDWNNGPPPAYYKIDLKQKELLKRLIMYGYTDEQKSDLSFGKVYGWNTSYVEGFIKTGLLDLGKREPHHW